jgi:hypothetical protein
MNACVIAPEKCCFLKTDTFYGSFLSMAGSVLYFHRLQAFNGVE